MLLFGGLSFAAFVSTVRRPVPTTGNGTNQRSRYPNPADDDEQNRRQDQKQNSYFHFFRPTLTKWPAKYAISPEASAGIMAASLMPCGKNS